MSPGETGRPGDSWLRKIAAIEPEAARQWPRGGVFDPHDGITSDANLHYHDLMADPDPDFDPMAGYVGPEETPATPAPEETQ